MNEINFSTEKICLLYRYNFFFKDDRIWNTYWLNNMDNIISFVSSGRFVKNKIWLGGCSGIVVGPAGAAGGCDGAVVAEKEMGVMRSLFKY